MGTAFYYGKLTFESEQAAQENLEIVTEFLHKLAEAERDWHNSRRKSDSQGLWLRNREVFETLGIPEDIEVDECMNQFAGKLDSPFTCGDENIFLYANEIRFSGEVWHFAEWDYLGAALRKITPAVKFGWISDEYVEDYFAQIP